MWELIHHYGKDVATVIGGICLWLCGVYITYWHRRKVRENMYGKRK